ncbi:MAG: glycosyltransferase [Bacteroidota bacterium]
MDKKFFLILSASGGAGHLRAAEGLHQAARRASVPIRTVHHDVLDFTSKAFKRLYAESYLNVVNKAPELWGYLYQQSESKPYRKAGLLKAFDRLNYKRYVQSLREINADAIICTHFLPFVSISDIVRKEGIQTPFFAATTDFDIHQLWVDPIVRRYYVYHEESAWQLQSKDVARERIVVKGIPLMPEFSTKQAKSASQKRLGIPADRFTVLVLSGGFGVGRIEDIVDHTATTLASFAPRRFTMLVVCGRNEKAKALLAKQPEPTNVERRIYGFVDNIHEMMDASDVLISKSGGLTSAEAMAKRLPLIVVDPIPGQESRNADIIVEHGAGWKAIDLANLSYKLHSVLKNPKILAHAQRATALLAKPNAAVDILEDVYKFLN